MIITIDGPTASGKSSVAKVLAQELKFDYLYTGLLYRALAYILVTYFNYQSENLVHPLEEHVREIMMTGDLVYQYDPHYGATITYQGNNITPFLKTADVDDWSSLVSVNKMVRETMVAFQRAYVQYHDTIVEGRDIGTVVFPQAQYKFFITASLEERARRWRQDQEKQGKTYTPEESLKQVHLRDERDSTRNISPLKVPKNAIIIDSTDRSLSSTLKEIKKYIPV